LDTLTLLQQQISRLDGYAIKKPANLNTPTTYYSQRDNYTMPGRTCNSSANAMYLNWLLLATGRSKLGGDDGYLKRLLSIGDSPDHSAQTQCLKGYGFSTQWNESGDEDSERDGNIDAIKQLLVGGIPVVVNIAHRGDIEAPTGGHVIMLAGYLKSSKEFLAQDPYGTLQSNYQDENGTLSVISNHEFYQRWQGGFRTLA
jgi:Peptidase_C39 like family